MPTTTWLGCSKGAIICRRKAIWTAQLRITRSQTCCWRNSVLQLKKSCYLDASSALSMSSLPWETSKRLRDSIAESSTWRRRRSSQRKPRSKMSMTLPQSCSRNNRRISHSNWVCRGTWSMKMAVFWKRTKGSIWRMRHWNRESSSWMRRIKESRKRIDDWILKTISSKNCLTVRRNDQPFKMFLFEFLFYYTSL